MPIKAGLIGLGRMGKALATRLGAKGVELYAWNHAHQGPPLPLKNRQGHILSPSAGVATRTKLINNLLLGAFMASVAEALSLAWKAGLDRAAALEIFSKGAGDSAVLSACSRKRTLARTSRLLSW